PRHTDRGAHRRLRARASAASHLPPVRHLAGHRDGDRGGFHPGACNRAGHRLHPAGAGIRGARRGGAGHSAQADEGGLGRGHGAPQGVRRNTDDPVLNDDARWSAHFEELPMVGFIFRAVIAALGLWLATAWVTGIYIDSPVTLLLAGALLGVVNAFVRPIAVILTFPFTILT